MRAAIGSTGLALVVALAVGAAAPTVPAGEAATTLQRGVTAVIAVGSHGATAALADGRAQVGCRGCFQETRVPLPPETGVASHSRSARDGSSEIYVADVTTGRVSRLTDNAKAEDVEPSWSPDGRRIVWAGGPPGAHDLLAMDRDGAHKHRLAGGLGNDVDPAWSPDGTRIAFASNRGGRYQLWLVGSSGGTPELLTTPGRARAPDWSPTANRIAYTGIVGPASDVWMVSLDGFTHRRLRTFRPTTAVRTGRRTVAGSPSSANGAARGASG